ncbi:MAG: hypothetical protein Unbinned4409contig1002_43 [Prokaryotic dsDNA virus sp.]|nr:MAG: hypothetical protein Unbinned4409contig1002_43 [Prokaryotic dsDNA virus sp.]|tara:strand:+ start:9165 stop:10076 length:912 start_codon:yes stop_codon:yes gene_type:complete
MEQDKSNPNGQLPADNKAANDQVFGSSSEFFEQLEREVNGGVDDSLVENAGQQTPEARNEPPVSSEGPEMATPQNIQGNSNSIDWEKRYKDSSREAQKLSARVKQLKPFEPLMDVMRKDDGLVKHIKDYLQNGGAPAKSVKEELGLNDDFHYDPNEALDNPESDSAKVFNASVDKAVETKVSKVLAQENQKKAKIAAQQKLAVEANKFQKANNLNGEQMKAVLKKAYDSKLTFDDAYLLLNKGKSAQNIANNVRKEVVQQMENVRNIPQSASQTNSAQAEKSKSDQIFDNLLGTDETVDNLFG